MPFTRASRPRHRGFGFAADLQRSRRSLRLRGEETPPYPSNLANLLDNAFKYTESGWVEFRMTVENNRILCFAVEDTGVGIAKERVEDIFKPFVRLENPERKPVRGAGLGLAIVQQLVRSIQGTLHVESTPGSGTTVQLKLPLLPDESIGKVDV